MRLRHSLSCLVVATLVSFFAADSARAVALAFADFDGRTANGASTDGLSWVLEPGGIGDPGDMTNNRANLFDGPNKPVVQNNFTPGINVGNTNSTWITEVDITALAASTVTLTDVTFNAVSVSGSQVLNVNRRNDYIVTLLDPSATELETITVPDIVSGTGAGQPLVTIDFADVLLRAGTYTLRIEAGDAPGVGSNETGNHTGLDNLSINGTIDGGGPTPLAGDFNGDGTVDAADYTVFADNEGQTDEMALAPGTGDGMNGIDSADYDLWRANFGNTTPPLLGGGGGAIPEPATLVLVGMGGLCMLLRHRWG